MIIITTTKITITATMIIRAMIYTARPLTDKVEHTHYANVADLQPIRQEKTTSSSSAEVPDIEIHIPVWTAAAKTSIVAKAIRSASANSMYIWKMYSCRRKKHCMPPRNTMQKCASVGKKCRETVLFDNIFHIRQNCSHYSRGSRLNVL